MAKGSSRAITKDGGSASKSSVRSTILSSKDNMRVFLRSRYRERQTDHASGGLILQESLLVRFEKQVLDVPRGQHEKLPVRVRQHVSSGHAGLMQAKCDVGK